MLTGATGAEIGPSSSPFGAIVECPSRSRCAHAPGPPPGWAHAQGAPPCAHPGPKAKEQAVRERQGHPSQNVCALPAVHPGRRLEVVHGLRETASKQRCCTRLTCRSLTAVCARLTLRARAPMLVAHRRRREKMAPGMCAPMAVRSSPCDPSSCTDLISSQTTFYLSQTRAESLVLTWSIFPVAPLTQVELLQPLKHVNRGAFRSAVASRMRVTPVGAFGRQSRHGNAERRSSVPR